MNFPRTIAGPPGEERPAALLKPWPQGKMKRHDGIAYELVQSFRCSCAADGGTAAESRAVLCHAVAGGCRAGYRSAEDLASRCSSATLVSRHAAGGTAGGSADDRILLLIAADLGAARRHSSSSWSWRAKRWSSRFSPGTWVRECPGTSAHPRRLPMACAVGWMTTDPVLCSWWYSLRTHRSQWTRCGSAELAVAGAGGRPSEHAVQVPSVFVHEPGCASVHQQYGGHSSCTQFLVRTVHTVQQTVLWGWLSCSCCCATTGALVGACRKLWISAVAVLLGVAQCLVRLWIHVCIIQGGF